MRSSPFAIRNCLVFSSRKRQIDPNKDTQFSEAWMVLAVLVGLFGVAIGNAFLLTAAIMLLTVAGVGWLWAAVSLLGLSYSRHFSEVRAFQGETIELRLEVHNRKLVPLMWLSIRDVFPPELRLAEKDLEINRATNLAEFNSFWMLGPFQRVSRRFDIRCTERGHHRYGPAAARTGDGFGFFNRGGEFPVEQRLIVYPRLYSVTELRLPTKNPFGDTRATGSLIEDPLRTVGIREWQAADSMRRIHWKATARQQALLSRLYEPSEEQLVQIFLNVATMQRHWHGYIPELQERAISVAGSLAALAAEQRLPVGVVANGSMPGSDQPIRALPGRNPNQLMTILEMLAAVTPFATETIEQLLLHEAPRMPWGATLVVVTAITHDELLATLIDLAEAGRRIVLFTLAKEPPSEYLARISVYHLPHLVDDLIAPQRVSAPANRVSVR